MFSNDETSGPECEPSPKPATVLPGEIEAALAEVDESIVKCVYAMIAAGRSFGSLKEELAAYAEIWNRLGEGADERLKAGLSTAMNMAHYRRLFTPLEDGQPE